MSITRFFLVLSFDFPPSCIKSGEQELFYQAYIKPLIQLLYARSDWSFSMGLNHEIGDWLTNHHPEALTALLEMSNRKQLEILGGAYNDAFLGILSTNSRLEQLESQSVWIRSTFGKKPHGAYLAHGIWEPSLAYTLAACDIEFTFLPRNLFLNANCIDASCPHIIEEAGKNILAIPYHQFDKENDPYIEQELILSLPGQKESILGLMLHNGQASWLEKLINGLYVHGANLCLPSLFFKKMSSVQNFPLAYLPPSDAKILGKSDGFYRNAILKKSENRWLYARVLYSTLMARQIKNDKSRRRTAIETIGQIQNHQFYWNSTFGGISHPLMREFAYKELLRADQLARDVRAVSYGFVRTDFDYDHLQEAIYHSPQYIAMSHQHGGIMFELSLFCSRKNLLTIYSGGESQKIKRAFHDLLLSEETTIDEWRNNIADRSNFEITQYEIKENKSDPATILYSCELPIQETLLQIKKRFTYKPNKFMVEYTLCNNALGNIKKNFCVELNLASLSQFHLYDMQMVPLKNLDNMRSLLIIDESSQSGLQLELSQPASIWRKNLFNYVKTISCSEEIFQGESLLINWQCTIIPSARKNYNIKVTLINLVNEEIS
ncbi:MAG: alpha-amylase/4-alpha-glucanotransferase domain-containing protein [Spirochaetia bacterium]